MANASNWYIVNVRSGRELFLHELFEKAGFTVYTPFITKFQTHRTHKARLKARNERRPRIAYADPMFKGYLFVGSSEPWEEAIMGIKYIIENRVDAYDYYIKRKGSGFVPVMIDVEAWKAALYEHHKDNKRAIIRGYDRRKDARKNQSPLYGSDIIKIPRFTKGEKVEFLNGGFQSLGARVSRVDDETIYVITQLFGVEREIKVDPFELQKAG